jgi:hypothetical protein
MNQINIIDYIEDNASIFKKTHRGGKHPSYVDRRNYLVFILVTQHDYRPTDIAKIFEIHRTNFYTILKAVSNYWNDSLFWVHCEKEVELFPYYKKDTDKLEDLLNSRKVTVKDPTEPKVIVKVIKEKNVFRLSKKDIEKMKNNPKLVTILKRLIRIS